MGYGQLQPVDRPGRPCRGPGDKPESGGYDALAGRLCPQPFGRLRRFPLHTLARGNPREMLKSLAAYLVASTLLLTGCGISRAEAASRAEPAPADPVRESLEAIGSPGRGDGTSLQEAQRFDPLVPVDTAGPREVLADFLRRMDSVQSIFRLTIASYLGSGRLFTSAEERAAMARSMTMAEVADDLLEFEGLPVAVESQEFRARVLLTLRDLLARVALPPLHEIPDGASMAAAGKTSWHVPGTGIEIRRMSEGPRTGEWLFTAETILRLPEWHDYASALPYIDKSADGFRDFYVYSPIGLQRVIPPRWMLDMPPLLNARIIGEPVWRWLGLLVGLAVAWGLLAALTRWLAWRDARTAGVTTGDLWRRLLLPLAFGLLLFGLRWFIAHGLRFSSGVYTAFMIGFTVLIYAVVIRVLWLAASAMAESLIASKHINTKSVDGQLVRLTMRFSAVVLTFGVLIEGANRLGLPAYSILTGLGVGGVAVALAARESLANLMGSFIVMIEKPFRVGQKIRVGGVEGIVEDIGFRSTRVRTSYDSLVSVPSSKILEAPIDNLGLRNARQVRTSVAVAHGTSRDLLIRFTDAVREAIATHPQTRKDGIEVGLRDLAESGPVIALDFLLDVRDSGAELRCREDILLRIMECAERLGVEFAAPQSGRVSDPALRS